MGMMNTQPLSNQYQNSNAQKNYNRLFPERNSAVSLQIGGGTYSNLNNKQKVRLAQKAKNRSGVNKLLIGMNNYENYNVRYTKYHQIYANKSNGPVRVIQKKNEKLTSNRITKLEGQMVGKRK